MSVIEKFAAIGNTISKLFEFIETDESIKDDFSEYIKTVGAAQTGNLQPLLVTYLMERRLFENKKTIMELFLDSNPKIDKLEKTIVAALQNATASIFEIKKVTQHGFVFYNLVNEVEYEVLSLVKMSNYRGIYPSQFAVARIFKFENEYYLLEISDTLSALSKEHAFRYAIAKLIQNPSALYQDNPKKKTELETQIKTLSAMFKECFGSDEIITTNRHADNLIGIFNDFCDNKNSRDMGEIEKNIVPPEKYGYFDIEEFNNTYDNFLEKSLGGFSAHTATYDVGIIYDEALGLFAIPFYATLCKIFEAKDYTEIPGYKSCIVRFLENEKIPASLVKRLNAKYKNFVDVTNTVLEKDYTIESLLSYYKKDSLEKPLYSPTSVLYSSDIFSKVVGEVQEQELEEEKPSISDANIGRNDPCPCGSGKKYKKCCLK